MGGDCMTLIFGFVKGVKDSLHSCGDVFEGFEGEVVGGVENVNGLLYIFKCSRHGVVVCG